MGEGPPSWRPGRGQVPPLTQPWAMGGPVSHGWAVGAWPAPRRRGCPSCSAPAQPGPTRWKHHKCRKKAGLVHKRHRNVTLNQDLRPPLSVHSRRTLIHVCLHCNLFC